MKKSILFPHFYFLLQDIQYDLLYRIIEHISEGNIFPCSVCFLTGEYLEQSVKQFLKILQIYSQLKEKIKEE